MKIGYFRDHSIFRQFVHIWQYNTNLQLQNNWRRELKTRLMDEWAQFDQSIVDAANSQWRRRLSACVAGHTSNINFDNFELNYNTILQFC